MLIFTNRKPKGSGFGDAFSPGASDLSFATATSTPDGSWTFADLEKNADDEAIANAVINVLAAGRPVLLYIHGNNNTPAQCLERCTALDAMYGVEVIAFSWASEGYQSDGNPLANGENDTPGDENDLAKITKANKSLGWISRKALRYRQAKNNAIDSVESLARFLRLLSIARLHIDAAPFSVAAHSLGSHFLEYTLDIDTAREALGTAYNVALLAPCVRSTSHKVWVEFIRPKGKVFITYNEGDNVLTAATIADKGQVKLGLDPGTDLVQNGIVRYVCFSNSLVGLFGHGYFVHDKVLKKTKELFSRVFKSLPDLNAGEHPSKVYALGCDPDGVTCWVGAPKDPDGG